MPMWGLPAFGAQLQGHHGLASRALDVVYPVFKGCAGGFFIKDEVSAGHSRTGCEVELDLKFE